MQLRLQFEDPDLRSVCPHSKFGALFSIQYIFVTKPFYEDMLVNFLSFVQIVLLLRLVPLLPFNMLNYLLSVTSVSLVPYLLASWLGMIVRAFLINQNLPTLKFFLLNFSSFFSQISEEYCDAEQIIIVTILVLLLL